MDIFKEIKKVSKIALEKGKEAGKFAKLKFDIAFLESEIKDLKFNIGEIVCKEKIEIKNDKIENIIKKIDLKLKEVKKKRSELKDVNDDQNDE